MLVGLFTHVNSTGTLYVLIVLRQRQLGEQIFVHRFDIIAYEELIHVIIELLLIHIVHRLIHAYLMTAKVILGGRSQGRAYCPIVLTNVILRQSLRVLRQEFLVSYHSGCASAFTSLLLS